MVNKNIAFGEICSFPAILGACSGIFVAMMCGTGLVETKTTVDRTVDRTRYHDEKWNDALVCASVSIKVPFSHEQEWLNPWYSSYTSWWASPRVR